ncbi:MAG: hypothetical protein U0841_35390, partial [Chloroflexia bacterium]
MKTFLRSSAVACATMLGLLACRRDAASPGPINSPDVLVMSLQVTPDTLGPDDQIRLEMRADNPTALPVQLARGACAEDLLGLSVVDASGALTPTISGIPCKLAARDLVLPAGGSIAKVLQISAFAVLGTRVPGSYR